MSSYVITGAARGIGWEFLNQLSSDAKNTVIGLVRNKADTDKKVAEQLKGRSNITILEADLTNYDALKKAAADTAAITGGSLDYLIANAAYQPLFEAFSGIGDLASKPDELTQEFRKTMDTDVLSNIFLYNFFMPQILKGKVKKVIFITSGHGDLDLIKDFDIEVSPIYSATKAAMNVISAKFSAQYKKDGVLFLSISPGVVDTGHFAEIPPELLPAIQGTMQKFQAYAPNWKGPITPQESVSAILSTVEKKSIENGDGGDFISHLGTKQWL